MTSTQIPRERARDRRGPELGSRQTVPARVPPAGRKVLMALEAPAGGAEVQRILSDAGWDVVGQQGNAEQLIAMADELRPDAMVMDTVRAIHHRSSTAAAIAHGRLAPVVVMADDDTQPGDFRQALEAGAMGYVTRPFTRERLIPTIEMAVARHADAMALRTEISAVADRLDARKVIERAKGLLMVEQHTTEQEAFRWLQRRSMDRRTSMRSVAQAVVERLSTR